MADYERTVELAAPAGKAYAHVHAEHDSPDDQALINRGFDETMRRMKELVDEGR